MLSRWLNPVNPVSPTSPTRQPISPESSIDDAHTRDLLFPPPSLLHHSQAHVYPLSTLYTLPGPGPGSGYDLVQRHIHLNGSEDVRIIIAQDETAETGTPSLLFDSAPPERPRSPLSPRIPSARPKNSGDEQTRHNVGYAPLTSATGSSHQGMESVTICSEQTISRTCSPGTVFSRSFGPKRARGSSLSSVSESSMEGDNRRLNQLDDFSRNCLECMFGKHKLSYKGPSTKLHVLSQPSTQAGPTNSASTDALGASGRAGRRLRSQLSKSYTPLDADAEFHGYYANSRHQGSRGGSQQSQLMITRTFDVPMTNRTSSDYASSTTPATDGKSFLFPETHHKDVADRSDKYTGQSRSAIFAIAVIVKLPAAHTTLSARSVSKHSGFHLSCSSQTSDSLGSSLDSEKPAAWTFLDPFPKVESSCLATDEDPLHFVTQHLDVFQRTLTSLQSLVQTKLSALLKRPEATSSPYAPPATAYNSRTAPGTLVRNARSSTIRLRAYELADDEELRESVAHAVRRIVSGTSTLQVITGQGRWGIWREELRWVDRWVARGEHSSFLVRLLTGYLALHTEWLNDLAPEWYRRRRIAEHNSTSTDDLILTHRTVVVSKNKMAARRLVFLLSAFLPPSVALCHGRLEGVFRTGKSLFTPPSELSQDKGSPNQQSLSVHHSFRLPEQDASGKEKRVPTHSGRTGRISETMFCQGHEWVGPPEEFRLMPQGGGRRSSDVEMIRDLTTAAASDAHRNSSATISMSTTALPIAHFANPTLGQRVEFAGSGPTGSSAGSVSSSVMHKLQTQNTANSSNTNPQTPLSPGWSFASLWTSSRPIETSTSESSSSCFRNEEGKTARCTEACSIPKQFSGCLEPMGQNTKDKGADGELYACDLEDDLDQDRRAPPSLNDSPQQSFNSPIASPSKAGHRQQHSTRSLLKLSVGSDGVIDVDIPLPAVGSPLHSPTKIEVSSTPSIGDTDSRGTRLCPCHYERDPPVRVAGWLERLHEDFELQGTHTYADLEGDLKRAMRAEPTPKSAAAVYPAAEQGAMEKWVEVCSTLVADAETCSVKRLRLRRKVRLYPVPSGQRTKPGPSVIPRVGSQKAHSCSRRSAVETVLMAEEHLEDKFIEEPMLDVDESLSDAVEKLLAQSTQSALVPSAAVSNPNPKRRSQDNNTKKIGSAPIPEVSRGDCGEIILGALKDIIKTVQKDRLMESRDDDEKGRSRKSASTTCLREGVRRWLDEVEKPLEAC